MKTIYRNSDVIDATYRVIEPARHTPTKSDFVLAALLTLGCMVSIGGGVYVGMPISGWGFALLLCSLAALTTASHKHLAPIAFALALVIGLSGCSPTPLPAANKDKAAIDASIRAATRYQDPREGWESKPMPIPGSSQPSVPETEVDHERR